MWYPGDPRLGTMPILAKNGGYQFSPTNRTHPYFGHHNRRARVPNIFTSLATQCTRGLPLVVRKTMDVNAAYQTKLAEKRDHLPKRKNQSTRTHTTMRRDQYGIETTIREKHQHVGRSSQWRGQPVPRRASENCAIIWSRHNRSRLTVCDLPGKGIGWSGGVKNRHYVRIVRRNHRGSRLEGFNAQTYNTSKL